MSISKGIIRAIVAGSFGALSSVCGKLATDGNQKLVENTLCIIFHNLCEQRSQIIDSVEYISRFLLFFMNIVFTGMMWSNFVISMQHLNTTTASLLNTAANFVFTAMLAVLIFDEALQVSWWLGASLMVGGVCLLVAGEQQSTSLNKKQS
eukprot:gb/GECH01011641.1/.p1 GENE.gb/GECH01011641.1/~~gb/GECH01011641.1/.p1  ORF type:complete len:150 (+),score=25.13 gb/GECH01011641.1/:1-450(+)